MHFLSLDLILLYEANSGVIVRRAPNVFSFPFTTLQQPAALGCDARVAHSVRVNRISISRRKVDLYLTNILSANHSRPLDSYKQSNRKSSRTVNSVLKISKFLWRVHFPLSSRIETVEQEWHRRTRLEGEVVRGRFHGPEMDRVTCIRETGVVASSLVN